MHLENKTFTTYPSARNKSKKTSFEFINTNNCFLITDTLYNFNI